MYVVNETKPAWSPKLVIQEFKDQIKSIQVLKLRIDQLKERAHGILKLVRACRTSARHSHNLRRLRQVTYGSQIFNNISIRQARLTIEQAERNMGISALQRYDTYLSYQQGESMHRISTLNTIFLPLSLTTVSSRDRARPFFLEELTTIPGISWHELQGD